MAHALGVCAVCSSCGGDYWLGGARGGSGGGASGGAGGTTSNPRIYDLDGDIVLTGADAREFGDPAGCRILGNGHSIRSTSPWYGHLWIHDCEIIGLGSADVDAISLEMAGSAWTTIERCSFATSGVVRFTNQDDSTTTFTHNLILENSVVTIDTETGATTPAFVAAGSGEAPKLFQGNGVYRSGAVFRSANWLIGGDTDAESNVVAGLQGSLLLSAPGLVVRGNYVHNVHVPVVGDDSTIAVAYGTDDVLAEHNVLRRGTWVVRGFGGELRYNALLDADDLAWLQQPFEGTKIHHNVLAMCEAPSGVDGIQGGIQVVNSRATGIEIYNNSFDGGGVAIDFRGPAVSINDGCFVNSLRSNLFYGFRHWSSNGSEAAIRPGIGEPIDPPPPRIGYADYNLFFNPEANLIRNYAVAVPNRELRIDAGFALNDAPAGGAVDEQVDPRLQSPRGDCFPWTDDDIKARRVKVSEMLAYFRAAYAPAPGSPLTGAGDPADGSDNTIGAIGDGSLAIDQFGRFTR